MNLLDYRAADTIAVEERNIKELEATKASKLLSTIVEVSLKSLLSLAT